MTHRIANGILTLGDDATGAQAPGINSGSNTDIDIGTEAVDSFTYSGGGANDTKGSCLYHYHVSNNGNQYQESGLIVIEWFDATWAPAEGYVTAYPRSNNSDVSFTCTLTNNGDGTYTVALNVTVTSFDNWTGQVKRLAEPIIHNGTFPQYVA